MNSHILGRRYRRILFFFARVIAGLLWWEWLLPRLGLRYRANQTRSARLRRTAAQFRVLATKMGGVMIKVGQFLSSRVDVLPPEILEELATLQDEVPPEDFGALRALAEQELGVRLEDSFASLDETPLAAASLGQVHRARLRPAAAITTGGGNIVDVVVKIQRPGIERVVQTDLAALRRVATWLQHYPSVGKHANAPALMDEFVRSTREELDYLAEGRNAETVAANMARQAGICVPQVDWAHTTQRVLTLEDVYAIKITDYAAITAAGIDRSAVAHRLFKAYLHQIFIDGFFHADPHPGNLFVERVDDVEAGGWQLTFVDFGMVGRISPRLREGLREMAIAMVAQDSARLVHSFQALDLLLPGADLAMLEQAQARFLALLGGKNMAELRQVERRQLEQFADDFRELLYDMPFQIPTNLLLLGRAIGILSGMCTGLDPAFDLWSDLEPFVQQFVEAETGPGVQQLVGEAGKIISALAALPVKTSHVLDIMERDGLVVRAPDLARHLSRLEREAHLVSAGIVFAALLLGGVQLELGGSHTFATVLLAAAGLTLVWFILPHRH